MAIKPTVVDPSPASPVLQTPRRWSVVTLVSALLVASCSQNTSSLPRDTQDVDGMTIDIGVIPAELVQGHPIQPGEPNALHGGTPKDSGSRHLVVALFDAKTGVRITDAHIQAGIGDRSDNHAPEKVLEPMQINATVTYGNFFLIQGPGPWRIHLEIQRLGIAHKSQADFAYVPNS